MNHHHQKILDSLFAHPISANVDFKDIERLLSDLGADLDQKSGNRLGISLNGHSFVLHRPHHHTLTKDDVAGLRDFLTLCGVAPTQAA